MTVDDFKRTWPQVLIRELAQLPPDSEVHYMEFGILTPEGVLAPVRVHVEEQH